MPPQGVTTPQGDLDVIAQTGISGLDDILNGGLSKGRYKATYSVLNTDGHVVTKSWNFNLK